MDTKTAAKIAKASRALRHCEKLLETIEKKGEVKIVLNCTGVTFIVKKDDAMYRRIFTTRAQLLEEIASINVTMSEPIAPVVTEEEKAEARRKKQREYMRGYNARKRAEKLAAAT